MEAEDRAGGEAAAATVTGRLRGWSSALAGLGSLVIGGAAVVWSHLRRPPDTEWAAVALWAISVAAMALACREPGRVHGWWRQLSRGDLTALFAVLAAAIVLHAPRLSVYPLEVGGDPLRDGGLLTWWMLTGEIKEPFSYSFFHGFTNVVPLLAIPFRLLFGASSLAFKAPAATVGVLTAVLLFVVARRYLPVLHALLASLFLLSLPIFLYYSRLETLVAFNSFWMVLVLAALLRVFERRAAPRALGTLGLVAGLTTFFHAAVKAAAFLALALAGGWAAWRALRRFHPWSRLAIGSCAAIAGFVVGLGPLILETNPAVLLSLERLGTGSGAGFDPTALLDAYQRSLRVFFDQAITFRFPVEEPLIPSTVLACLFAVGAGLGFLAVPRHVHAALLFFALLLPLTNSAVTDARYAAHRLAPLLPIAAFLVAAGLSAVWRGAGALRPPALASLAQVILVTVAVLATTLQATSFFTEEKGRVRHLIVPHLMHFALVEIEATPTLRDAPNLCVGGNQWLWSQLDLLHHREGWRFYRPEQQVHLEVIPGEPPANEIYVSTCLPDAPPQGWTARRFCSPRLSFVCPGDETGIDEVRVMVDARPAVAEAQVAPPAPAVKSSPPIYRSRLDDAAPVTKGTLPPDGARKLDLAAMLAAGDVEIQVNDPTFAPQVGALFDGAQEPLIRTNNVNPLVLEIAPRSPIRLRSVRAMFAASRYDWVLEAAPGAPRLLAPEVPEWEWSSIEPPEGEPTSRVRLEILRLERDDYVHVSELELWVDPEP